MKAGLSSRINHARCAWISDKMHCQDLVLTGSSDILYDLIDIHAIGEIPERVVKLPPATPFAPFRANGVGIVDRFSQVEVNYGAVDDTVPYCSEGGHVNWILLIGKNWLLLVDKAQMEGHPSLFPKTHT
jgi:hypothetical protein